MLVDLVPVGDVADGVLREAAHALEEIYECDTSIHDEEDVPEDTYNDDRDQHEAGQFIELVSDVGDGDKTLGITEHDLFYRRRNYVFGLAYLGGGGSVISTNRLNMVSDGGISNKPEEEIVADRIRKEAVHEIGHTFGLEHCDNKRCVMSFSPTVREVDIKEETLCGTCSRQTPYPDTDDDADLM